MRLSTRKLLDRSFSAIGVLAIALMAAVLIVLLAPIFRKGFGAFIFKATIEHERVLLEKFEHGSREDLAPRLAAARAAREPVYSMLRTFRENDLKAAKGARKRELKDSLHELEDRLEELLGPDPDGRLPVLPRQQYGQTRWARARIKLNDLLNVETWDYSDMSGMGVKVLKPRVEEFRGTSLEPLFEYLTGHIDEMLQPHWTFYGGFFTHDSLDAHFFGGIWPEILGTFYLTALSMLFAVPLGVVAAVYFTEYARPGRLMSLLRSCVSTLAGVPSIVFGLFGLAFFINTMHVSPSKSVLAGALTLGLLVLPTVIRASEEAILAVPGTYREAALSLGANRFYTILTVIVPAALPGILTGIVISMGRAAGETAPIIFTAAVSVGRALKPSQLFTEPTPALSWNIYNLCSEHESVDEIRHIQFGMVTTLILLVLLLNVAAIIMRARISRRLKG